MASPHSQTCAAHDIGAAVDAFGDAIRILARFCEAGGQLNLLRSGVQISPGGGFIVWVTVTEGLALGR
jgi:hypothetical protein